MDWDEEENVEDWLQNLMANERDPMLREQLMAIQGMAEVRIVGGAAGIAAESSDEVCRSLTRCSSDS